MTTLLLLVITPPLVAAPGWPVAGAVGLALLGVLAGLGLLLLAWVLRRFFGL